MVKVQLVYSSKQKIETTTIQSIEDAIQIFESYSWEKEFGIAKTKKFNKFTPEILFIKEDSDTLSIAGNGSEFIIFFESQGEFAEFHISNDARLNPEGIIPQIYIKLHMEGLLRESIEPEVFQKIISDNHKTTEFQVFKYEKSEERGILIPVFYMYLLSIMLITLGVLANDSTAIGAIAFLLLFTIGIPLQYTLLYFNYLKYNRDTIVMIHKTNGGIIYKNKEQTIKFNKNDIVSKEHIIKDFKAKASPNMEYLRLGLNNKNSIIITSLLGECYYIAELLVGNFTKQVMTFPFVRLKK